MVALSCLLLLGAPAHAADDVPVSADAGFDWVSRFVFRGVTYEEEGIIFQPWADLRLTPYLREAGPLRAVTATVGFWSSLHSVETDAEVPPEAFYEVNLAPSVTLDWAHGISTELRYTIFSSPSRAFDTAHELGLYARNGYSWEGRYSLKNEVLIAIPTYTPYPRLTYAHLQTKPAYAFFQRGDTEARAYSQLRLGLNVVGEDEVGRTGGPSFRYLQTGLGVAITHAPGRQGVEAYLQGDLFHISSAFEEGLDRPDGREEAVSAGFAAWF